MTLLTKSMHCHAIEVLLEGRRKAFSYFLEHSTGLIGFKRIEAVELEMFYVVHGWNLLQSRFQGIGVSSDDLEALLGRLIFNYANMIVQRLKNTNTMEHEDNQSYWSKEFTKRLVAYRNILIETDISTEAFMQSGYKKMFKPGIFNFILTPPIKSKLGKVFIKSVYVETTLINEGLQSMLNDNRIVSIAGINVNLIKLPEISKMWDHDPVNTEEQLSWIANMYHEGDICMAAMALEMDLNKI